MCLPDVSSLTFCMGGMESIIQEYSLEKHNKLFGVVTS
jgi:hypothetical protein